MEADASWRQFHGKNRTFLLNGHNVYKVNTISMTPKRPSAGDLKRTAAASTQNTGSIWSMLFFRNIPFQFNRFQNVQIDTASVHDEDLFSLKGLLKLLNLSRRFHLLKRCVNDSEVEENIWGCWIRKGSLSIGKKMLETGRGEGDWRLCWRFWWTTNEMNSPRNICIKIESIVYNVTYKLHIVNAVKLKPNWTHHPLKPTSEAVNWLGVRNNLLPIPNC